MSGVIMIMFGFLKVPPLRLRPADIADMAVYFSRQLAKRSAVRQLGLTSGAVRQLESYDFPNNIQVPPAVGQLPTRCRTMLCTLSSQTRQHVLASLCSLGNDVLHTAPGVA